MSKAKETWERWGEVDPYFAVATFDKFRTEKLTDAAKDEFFLTGEKYVQSVWNEVQTNFVSQFRPERALDFGCGVGRIVIPMAARVQRVWGVDISKSMLNEARRNCEERSLDNVEFLLTADFLSREDLKFDLIHSFIVFQHVRPSIGIQILRRMLTMLADDGIGILHFTYANKTRFFQKLRSAAYREIPFLYRMRNVVKRGGSYPLVPMYVYDLNKIMAEFQDAGCHDCFVRYSDHGYYGALLFVQKHQRPLY